MPTPLLTVEDLVVEFPRRDGSAVRAVDGVSFRVARGETLALVGESGSGKSVTAMALTRLTEHDGGVIRGGRILLGGAGGETIDVVQAPASRLRRLRGRDIAYVFQEPMTCLNPVHTVGDQIVEAIRLHQGVGAGRARALALAMLERVRLPDPGRQLARYPHQLSGGMRQRVMIAMALSSRPSLLVADEPTTALDVTIQAQVLALVRHLQRESDMAVLFITHDMGVVAEIADRVCVLHRGRVVEEGTVADLFARPRAAQTRALLDAVPVLGSMRGKPGPERFPEVSSTGHRPPATGHSPPLDRQAPR